MDGQGGLICKFHHEGSYSFLSSSCGTGLRRVGYDEVQRAFAAVDLDDDGVIQRDELMTVFEKRDANNQLEVYLTYFVIKLIIFLGLLAVVLGDKTNRLPQLFYLIDSDNDGVININEMKIGYDSEDVNGYGVLTFDEFAAGSHPGSPPLDLQSAFDFFDELDQKKDGKVDKSAVVILFNGLDEDCEFDIFLNEGDDAVDGAGSSAWYGVTAMLWQRNNMLDAG
ncbi:hypothetical protein C0Q70_13021 [Pomacea canaliculata]|uniref:EF-hand domain-containing protein n=1 Tax=Pomacea canaliculata TaxID=400727 RepID=A0A2T7P362_POMCA|nr:hypothetical protein C0Q70_13021 [Pomacea canaliculata]